MKDMLPPQYVSSGSEGDAVIDVKKKRRMISNRESAKRSRMKKQRHLEDLIREVDQLQKQNRQMVENIDGLLQRYNSMELENNVLRFEKMEMEDRFNRLNNVLDNVERNCYQGFELFDGYEGVDGFYMEDPDDPLMRPWQSSCTSQPIMASASMFHF